MGLYCNIIMQRYIFFLILCILGVITSNLFIIYVDKTNQKHCHPPMGNSASEFFQVSVAMGLFLLLGFLVVSSLLYSSEELALETVFGHLYSHQFLCRKYLFEFLEIFFFECCALDLYVG